MKPITSPNRPRRAGHLLAFLTALVALVGFATGGLPAAAQTVPVSSTEDITPPQVSNLVIDPVEFDVSDGSWKSWTASIQASDDLSGVGYINVQYILRSGDGNQVISITFGEPVSGDRKNGTYTASGWMEPTRASGIYELSSLSADDVVGNRRVYRANDIPGPTSLKVVGNTDVTPPQVTAVKVSPDVVDVSENRQRVAVEVAVTDDRNGVAGVHGTFSSPSGQQYSNFYGNEAYDRTGVAVGFAEIQRSAEPGNWRLTELCSSDRVGNRKCFDHRTMPSHLAVTLAVSSNPSDVARPEITAFRIPTAAIDVTNGSQEVSLEFDVSDDVAGVKYASIHMLSPINWSASPPELSHHHSAQAPAIRTASWDAEAGYREVEDNSKRVLSGTLRTTITFPQYTRAGEWRINGACVGDHVGRTQCYYVGGTPSLDTLGPPKVSVKWNQAPTVKVVGVTASRYLQNAEPTAACDVNDPEDGVVTGIRPTTVRSGDVATVTCSYTDNGIDGAVNKRTASDSVTYTVERRTNTAPTVQVTGVAPGSYEIGSEPVAGCSVEDAEDSAAKTTVELSPLDGTLSAYGAGERTATCRYTDTGGLAGTHSVRYTVVDTAKPTLHGGPTSPANAAGWHNSDVTIRWTADDAGVGIAADAKPADVLVAAEGRDQTRTASVTDRAGNGSGVVTSSPAVNLDKTSPTILSPTFTVNPKSVAQTSTISAEVRDDLSGVAGGELFIGTTDPGRGSGTSMTLVGGRLEASFGTNLAPGVYTLNIRAVDAAGNWSAPLVDSFVVYDPNGGFVTGGGRIVSPQGAYAADRSASGVANFGFVSKYQKGATTPTGTTEFRFQAASMNFHSQSYEWLVIAGARAQYKGTGTINGSGSYDFMLTAVDGQLPGGGGEDKLRMKITDRATGALVYDNQLGAGDGSAPSTAISSGSIIIHAS